MKLFQPLLLAITCLLSLSANATPTLTNVGANGSAGTVDCQIRLSNGRCDWHPVTSGQSFDRTGTASINASGASFSVIDPARGSASSSAAMSATSYLPELHAYAQTNAGYAPTRTNSNPARWSDEWHGAADATIVGVQGYRYDGAGPFDLFVTATLDSKFSLDGRLGNIGHSQMQVTIFDGNGYVFTYDDYSGCPVFDRMCAAGTSTTTSTLDTAGAILYNTGSATVMLHHIVMPGDIFYVGGTLDASVCCGGIVDSSHTLRMTFNDPGQLSSIAIAGVTAIPEPATLLLLLPCLALLVFARRRAGVFAQTVSTISVYK